MVVRRSEDRIAASDSVLETSCFRRGVDGGGVCWAKRAVEREDRLKSGPGDMVPRLGGVFLRGVVGGEVCGVKMMEVVSEGVDEDWDGAVWGDVEGVKMKDGVEVEEELEEGWEGVVGGGRPGRLSVKVNSWLRVPEKVKMLPGFEEESVFVWEAAWGVGDVGGE